MIVRATGRQLTSCNVMSDYRINGWKFSDFDGAQACLKMAADPCALTLTNEAIGFSVDVSYGEKSDSAAPSKRRVLLGNDLFIGDTVFSAGSQILPEFSLKTSGANAVLLIVAQITSGACSTRIVLTSSELMAGQQFSLAAADASNQNGPGKNCFARGTIIETPHGALPIEQLEDGDEILAFDASVQQISWTGKRRISGLELILHPQLQPVRIMAGALTSGRPGQDLLVSQNCGLLVDDWRAPYLFGEDEIMVPAESLLNNIKVLIECPLAGIDYFHLLVDGQAMVCANGLWAESMLPDAATLAMLNPSQRAEISDIAQHAAHADFAVLPALSRHRDITVAA